ncbi:MAG TPA: DUF58 domain-containing protein [Gemmataceae bacterium]|nr:DUF58 domain-containing protein [Gemmataceae bacterium]
MLTSRGCWFLLCVLLILSLGLLRPSLPLTLVGLTLLLWFAGQWLWFLVRLPGVRQLRSEREVWDDRSVVATLWAGQTFEVRVRLINEGWLPLPHVAAEDYSPFSVDFVDGSNLAQGTVAAHQQLEMTYRIRCGPAGLARFEGVRLQAADWQGFFYHVHFLHAVVILPILPLLTTRPSQPASVKRHNLLLPPGIHRFRRPGSGSELLDLRDYLPGDPPKTIAWKVSARRDRLITKEFESEVPVRCTLFVDMSSSVRVPTPSGVGSRQTRYQKALDRLVDLAAGVLQANAGIRDLTGLCLFDEHGARNIAPDRGSTHRTECLRLLAEAAARQPGQQCINPAHLLPLAYSFAVEIYPELLRPGVNSVPWAMMWLDGFSGYSHRLRLGFFELLHRHKSALRTLCWWTSFWALVLPVVLLSARVLLRTRSLDNVLLFVLFFAPLSVFATWAASAFLFGVDAVAGIGKRRRDRWRKQLAAILSVRYRLAPGGLATLLEDDDAFSLLLQRFLSEHQVPYTLPLYSPEGRYLFAAPEKVSVLAKALVRAVGKGRDNELFVLLADLLELDDALDPLLRAVRVALGRHHQVVLICPWPPGLELPPSAIRSPRSASRQGAKRRTGGGSRTTVLWDQLTTRRFHLAYQRLRRTFTRMGVAVLCAAEDEPIPLILSRLERLRSLGRPHS